MKQDLRIGLTGTILIAALSCSFPASAQHVASVSHSSVIGQPRVGHVVHRISRQPAASASASANFFGGSANTGLSSLTLQQLLDPVPPPGFDYRYLSAIDSDLAIKALIDPATQLRLAAAEHFTHGGRGGRGVRGFGGSGFYLLAPGYYLPAESDETEQPSDDQSQPQSQQPQIIVVQQAPPNENAGEQAEQPAESEPEVQEPLPDVGQFTLVLRNGTRIEAVAFTRLDDRIVYITAEGSRRTIALGDLDSGATVRINEERGTPLQLPL